MGVQMIVVLFPHMFMGSLAEGNEPDKETNGWWGPLEDTVWGSTSTLLKRTTYDSAKASHSARSGAMNPHHSTYDPTAA